MVRAFPDFLVIAVAPEEIIDSATPVAKACLASAASMVTGQHACQLCQTGWSRCCRTGTWHAFHSLDRVDLFLEVTGPVGGPMARYTAGQVLLCQPSSSILGFGRLAQFVRRLEGRRRNGIGVKAKIAFSSLVTRQGCVRPTDLTRLDRAFDIGTANRDPPGCTVISNFGLAVPLGSPAVGEFNAFSELGSSMPNRPSRTVPLFRWQRRGRAGGERQGPRFAAPVIILVVRSCGSLLVWVGSLACRVNPCLNRCG